MNDNIKKDWNETKFHSANADCISEIVNGKRRTALQNLSRRYLLFSNIALVMTCWSPFVFSSHIYPDHTKTYISIAFSVLFLICMVMNRWLYLGIRKIDCATMPIAEVSRLALFYRKRHLQFMTVLIPMAIAVIGSLIYSMVGNIYFIWGVILGVIVGLAIGIRQFMDFMSDYHDVAE